MRVRQISSLLDTALCFLHLYFFEKGLHYEVSFVEINKNKNAPLEKKPLHPIVLELVAAVNNLGII